MIRNREYVYRDQPAIDYTWNCQYAVSLKTAGLLVDADIDRFLQSYNYEDNIEEGMAKNNTNKVQVHVKEIDPNDPYIAYIQLWVERDAED